MKHHCYRKFAFTLAEVLITLGIIGVVAALVIPTFVRKYQYQVYATKLAEDYAILSNAIKMAEKEYGPQETWEFPDTSDYENFINTHLKPYLKTIDNQCTNKNTGKCSFQTKNMAGGTSINGIGVSGTEVWQQYKIYLANGAMVGILLHGAYKTATVLVDVNGEKGPNRQGVDSFLLILAFSDSIPQFQDYVGKFTFYWGVIGPGIRSSLIKQSCSKEHYFAGLGCGALLQRNGFKIPKNEGWPSGYKYPY